MTQTHRDKFSGMLLVKQATSAALPVLMPSCRKSGTFSSANGVSRDSVLSPMDTPLSDSSASSSSSSAS